MKDMLQLVGDWVFAFGLLVIGAVMIVAGAICFTYWCLVFLLPWLGLCLMAVSDLRKDLKNET